MARHELDEVECDEIYHALLERKSTLDKRAKDLEEKDGLPEAAQAVRHRIDLYNPNVEGKSARPGLIRQFAPQRDLEAEARNAREAKEGERDADGGQDLFGGGAETGGGHPPGETVPAKPRRSRGKRKGADAAEPEGAGSIGDETTDAAADPVEGALATLSTTAESLLAGDAKIDEALFDQLTGPIIDQIKMADPKMNTVRVLTNLDAEYRDADDNAHALGHYVKQFVELTREERDKPIGGAEAHTGTGQPVPEEGPDKTLKPVNEEDGKTSDVGDAAEPGLASLSFGEESH